MKRQDTKRHPVQMRRLGAGNIAEVRNMNALFAEVFADPAAYTGQPPDDRYLEGWLMTPNVIALAAEQSDHNVGGLVAYILPKHEQHRSEVYIYDLGVRATHRRQGIATRLIAALQDIAADIGAWVVFVQADYDDPAAIALYEKFGPPKDVLHFDIRPSRATR